MTQDNNSSPNKDKQLAMPQETGASIGVARHGISGDSRAPAEVRPATGSYAHTSTDEYAPPPLEGQRKDAMGSANESPTTGPALESKDTVVNTAVEVKDAVLEKASEITDVTAETITKAKDMVVDTMERTGAMRAGAATWRFAKANALPLALFSVGAGWMISERRRSRGKRMQRPYAGSSERFPTTSYPRVQSSSNAKALQSSMDRSAGYIGAQPGDALSKTEYKSPSRASRSAAYVSDRVKRAGTATRDFAVEHPLLVTMAMLCSGVGIGMLLPNGTSRARLRGLPEKHQTMTADMPPATPALASMAKVTAYDSMGAIR